MERLPRGEVLSQHTHHLQRAQPSRNWLAHMTVGLKGWRWMAESNTIHRQTTTIYLTTTTFHFEAGCESELDGLGLVFGVRVQRTQHHSPRQHEYYSIGEKWTCLSEKLLSTLFINYHPLLPANYISHSTAKNNLCDFCIQV